MKKETLHYDCSMCIHYNNGQCKQYNCIPNEVLDFTKTNWRSLFTLNKEETIEEAADYYLNNSFPEGFKYKEMSITRFINFCYDLVKLGANWQKEKESALIKEGAICLKESNILLEAMSNKIDKMYTEEEMRMNLIYCVAELMAHPKGTSDEMKIWNDKTNLWFENNKKK